jgi:hypothetical protein
VLIVNDLFHSGAELGVATAASLRRIHGRPHIHFNGVIFLHVTSCIREQIHPYHGTNQTHFQRGFSLLESISGNKWKLNADPI